MNPESNQNKEPLAQEEKSHGILLSMAIPVGFVVLLVIVSIILKSL
jgi:hypothetical protein